MRTPLPSFIAVACTFVLAAACAHTSAPAVAQNVAPQVAPSRQFVGGECRSDPELDLVLDGDYVAREAVTLLWCTTADPDSCQEITNVAKGRAVPHYSCSDDGKFAAIQEGDPHDVRKLVFYAFPDPHVVGTATLAGTGKSAGYSDLHWTPGEHFLRLWTAGSFVSLGVLYDVHGEVVLDFYAGAIELSPDGRYLAEYEPKGGPNPGRIVVYDLAFGRAIATRDRDVRGVTAVHWNARQVVFDYESPSGKVSFAVDTD